MIAPRLRRDFPSLQIRIAGGGDQLAHLKILAAEANRLCGAEDAVELLGHLDDPAAELSRADILVGVSRVAMEGAASGCAVVLCGNEGRGGILTPDDPAFGVGNFCCRGEQLPDGAWLEEVLRGLLSNPKARKRAAIDGRRWITEAYNSEGMARRVEAVYFAMTGFKNDKSNDKNDESGGA